jgi:hypothetical protein
MTALRLHLDPGTGCQAFAIHQFSRGHIIKDANERYRLRSPLRNGGLDGVRFRDWPTASFEELTNSSFVFSNLQPSLLRNSYGKQSGREASSSSVWPRHRARCSQLIHSGQLIRIGSGETAVTARI